MCRLKRMDTIRTVRTLHTAHTALTALTRRTTLVVSNRVRGYLEFGCHRYCSVTSIFNVVLLLTNAKNSDKMI